MKTTTIVRMSVCLLLAVLSIQAPLFAESSWPYEKETTAQRDERMAWWRQARFGMFIHWGVYNIPDGKYKGEKIRGLGEWIMLVAKIPVAEYKAYAKEFNPVKYDPDSWVRLAKEAGMKYIVTTSKHHDGFALFDSKVTDWDVVDATPYGKDLLKPLAEACRKHGMKLGFYYSQAQDWVHPGGAATGGNWDPAQEGSMDEYIRDIAAPQVKEILTNYGDIAVLWWDTARNMNKERADMLQPLLNLQPGIITNNRLGGGYQGDSSTPEQEIPATGLDSDWETCMTMNNSWGFKSYDHDWKSTETHIRNLVDITSKGGNYLLNVGPTAEGEIPQPSIDRLKEIGQWMKINGESIYETSASPFTKLPWGRCTKKSFINGATLYLHVFDWPQDGKLHLPGLKNEVQQTYFLTNNEHLTTTEEDGGLTVNLQGKPLDPIDTVVVLKVGGKLNVDETAPSSAESATVGPDINVPSPDSMTWATAPYSTSDTSIALVATTATDAAGVEYYFTCTAGGGNDSGWQDEASYSDTELSPDTQYTYTVTARDKSPAQNTTGASIPLYATTGEKNLILPDTAGNLDSFTSEYSGGWPASALTNGVTAEDGWASEINPVRPQEFVYSFQSGQDATLHRAVIHLGHVGNGDFTSKDVEVWTSANGADYTLRGSGTFPNQSLALITIDLGGVTAKNVKLVITSGYNNDNFWELYYWELAEFEVYGKQRRRLLAP